MLYMTNKADTPPRHQLTRKGLFLLSLFVSWIVFINKSGAQPAPLFESDEILEFTLRGDLKSLFKDRSDDPQYHKVTLHYQEGGKTFNIPLKSKTRGNFRKNRGGCKIPPIFCYSAGSSHFISFLIS